MSVEAKASCTTTCASETDDGDYETSSEGAIRGSQSRQIVGDSPRNSEKMGSEQDYAEETPKFEEGESLKGSSESRDGVFASSLLIKSESMPTLKDVFSSEEENEEENIALTSESSLARQKKMEMIVACIGPLLSSVSNLAVSADVSGPDVVDERVKLEKLKSGAGLPVPEETDNEPPNYSKEVTFNDFPRTKEFHAETERSLSSSNARPKTPENPRMHQDMDDLIDIAENPHPSIKSFYFPPVFERDVARQHCRVTKDVDAFLKIDGELGPLQHKLNEITGKFRALNLTVPSLLSQARYSSQYAPTSDTSGYYLHRTETFGRDTNVVNCTASRARDVRAADYFGSPSFEPGSPETFPNSADLFPVKQTVNRNAGIANQNAFCPTKPRGSSSRFVGRDSSNLSNDSYVTVRNSYLQFGSSADRDISGSLIPAVSSSCYRCQRHGFDPQRPETSSYYDDPEAGGHYSGYGMQDEEMPCSSKSMGHGNRSLMKKTERINEVPRMKTSEDPGGPVSRPQKLNESVTPASCSPEMHLITINASLEKRYAGPVVSEENSNLERADGTPRNSKENSDCSFKTPPNRSVSASLTVIGSNGTSKTRFLNYTRVDSQTSLIVSRKDQNVMTSGIDCSQKKKSLRDLDVQCSGFNLKYEQKEVVLRKSVEKIAKTSESKEISKSTKNTKTVHVAKADEKVVIVPILFTDGVPDPPKVPLFNFRKSRHHVHRANHRLLKLEKRSSSMTQNSGYSGNSTDSAALGSSSMSHKLMNKPSGMSVSCVSRTGSSLRCRNPTHFTNTTKALSDYHQHNRCKHSHSNKAHSEPTKRATKKVIHGMRSSPEDFLCDT